MNARKRKIYLKVAAMSKTAVLLAGILTISALCTAVADAAQIKRIQRGTATFDTDDVATSVPLAYPVVQNKTIILLNFAGSSTNNRDQNWFFTSQFEDNQTIAIDRAGGSSDLRRSGSAGHLHCKD